MISLNVLLHFCENFRHGFTFLWTYFGLCFCVLFMQITSSCLVLLLTFGDWKESVDELEITGDWGVCVSSSSSCQIHFAILGNVFCNFDKYILQLWQIHNCRLVCVCILIIDKIRGTAAKTCPLLPLRMIGMGGGEAWRGLLKHRGLYYSFIGEKPHY